MKVTTQPFPGAYLIEPDQYADARGRFVKTFHESLWRELGIPPIHFAEEFWTVSAKNVLRGMHFQIPPCDHQKIVACLSGRVLDVLLDLRKERATFRQTWACELSQENAQILIIPKGVAHGFLSLSDNSLVHYKTTTVHSPEHDKGIKWNSFGFDWPHESPMISSRDRAFPAFDEFNSPF